MLALLSAAMNKLATVMDGGGLVSALAASGWKERWGRAGLLALALQLRPAWALLGVLALWGGAGSSSLLPRLRLLPAHPDWYLPALVQSCVTALALVALAHRFRTRWALLTAAVVGGVAWAATFAFMPSGLDPFSLMFRPLQEILGMAIILGCLAVTWNRPGPWGAIPIVALVGGVVAGALPLLFSNTIFGAPWPEGWPRGLAVEVCGVALLAVALAVMRQRGLLGEGFAGRSAAVGTGGLLLLTLVHLSAGFRFSAWTMDDSRRLVAAAILLAVLASAVAAAAAWERRSAARR